MKLLRASILLSVLFGLDKLVGLARQILMGRAYGITAALDAYNAANNLPDLLFAVISGGALAIAFIPVLTETLDREGRDAAWGLFSRVANWAFIITAAIALGLALFAGPLVRRVVVPGFAPEQQALVITLMRLDLIATLIFSISGLVIGGLQARQHFLLPALAPLLYNLGQIIGIVFLSKQFGIVGLAYGVILGAAMHLGVQLPALFHYGFRWTPALDWQHPGVRRVARLMAPRILTIAAIHVVFLTTDNFASHLPYAGAVTAIAYGWLILQLPETLIGTAIATALLPTLSEQVSRKEWAALKATLQRSIKVMIGITVPVTLIALVLVRPAVHVVFEGRAFTAQGADLVVAAAQMFLLGLMGHSLLEIAVRAFYAKQDARTPLIAAVLTAALFIALCFALIPRMGHAGIALANSLAFSAEATGLLWLLRRRGAI
nr:murein biosynthesis integral membrane protein MurJ [Chloroflexota bacterium]